MKLFALRATKDKPPFRRRTLPTPRLLLQLDPAWAFGVPGVLMVATTLLFWAGRNRFVHILPAQTQAANSLLVMMLVPTFSYLIYPAVQRRWRLTALRKIGLGMMLATTGLFFLVSRNIPEYTRLQSEVPGR